jgi:hypothetical protein
MSKLRLLILLVCVWCMSGCLAGKIAATPIVFVRDVVDAPLVSLTNVFETWADRSDPWAAPTPGVGWTWNGGFNAGIAYPLGFFVFKGLSGVFGSVDYIVCRSLYPNFASGLSPWKGAEQSWGDLYFPGTRAVWGDHPPDTTWEDDEKAPPDSSPPPKQ